jgi:hypothetical protein
MNDSEGLPMGTKLSHEVGLPGTTAGILLQHDSQWEGGVGGVYAHLDSIKPGRLLIGAERSPFSPYLWRTTIAQGYCRPKNDQSKEQAEGRSIGGRLGRGTDGPVSA